ncbi:MAG: thiamine phosphate synthase [Planctomycetes bacterium]|nr:thiamine phosphate synthase [Planctomycetota bacterium]
MQPILRILDANLNRAREGLRTCEEYARLAMNDARSAQAVKAARRAVAECSDLLGLERLLSARNVAADPGVQPEADDVSRATARDIALAGIKRAQEALRVVEEFSQLENRQAAAAAAKARYAAYEAEQQLFVAAPRRQLVRSSQVMVIFTRSLCRKPWPETLKALHGAGARLYQLREKEASAREFAEFAAAFTEQAPDACVIINDRADVAALHGAGVHVGQDDLHPDDARRVAGPAAIVGVSTHDVTEALRAEAQGADYIGLGAMFETGTKVVQSQIGPAAISEVTARVTIPVFAIGGITPGNVNQIASAGGRQAAVSSALLGADQPAEVYRLLLAELGEGR